MLDKKELWSLPKKRKERQIILTRIDQPYKISEIIANDQELDTFVNGRSLPIEFESYFILKINQFYPEYIYQVIEPTVRELIPIIIRLRRKIKRKFKLKLYDASLSSYTNLINFVFISVDRYGKYDGEIIIERRDGNLRIFK
ncbi:MAG: hypothetical protein PHC62_00425 [Candidatus Izemoplasmatales bacterium]|nr:hypothetical protein [Candidatus Izemoplasmatales bacterium]